MTRRACFYRSLATRSASRALVGLALVGYLATIGGFPLPAAPLVKDPGRPFPCQDHLCGCHDADQCWNDCCCHTPAERLAWALSHGVKMPRTAKVVVAVPPAHPARACCAAKTPPESGAVGQPSTDTAPTKGLAWGQLVRKCRGMATSWLVLGAVSAPPPRLVWNLDAPALDWLIVQPAMLDSWSGPPDSPPPRGDLSA